MRVLVYETSTDRAKLIEDLLLNYRYKVFINNNRLSLNQINEVKPTLIIMNGNSRKHVELLEKIKANSKYSNIPVIVISDENSRELLEKTTNLPNVDHLAEPFKIKNFRHMVERWVNFRTLYVN